MARRLICEADVLAMAPGEVLRLDSGTIVTPAALDAAHVRGVRVVREGERASGATRGTKKPCLWHRILETDGSYVVQVVNGRASVTRLEPGGPTPFGTDSVQEHNQR